jgi:tetratricopeptide (TPR) repeat protein
LFSFFYFASSRYEFEFVPALALLASVGVIAMEERARRGGLRVVARCAWIPALIISSAIPVLYGIECCASDRINSGLTSLTYGNIPGAEREFQAARLLSPGNPLLRLGSGLTLALERRTVEAQAALEGLVQDFPDYAMAHFVLGNVLASEGRGDEAIAQYRTAFRLDPDDAVIKAGLDSALARKK